MYPSHKAKVENMLKDSSRTSIKGFFEALQDLPEFSFDAGAMMGLEKVSIALRTIGKTNVESLLLTERSSLMILLATQGGLESWVPALEGLNLTPRIRFGSKDGPAASSPKVSTSPAKVTKIFRKGNFLSPEAHIEPKGLGEALRVCGGFSNIKVCFARQELYSAVLVKRPSIIVKGKRTDHEEWTEITKIFLKVPTTARALTTALATTLAPPQCPPPPSPPRPRLVVGGWASRTWGKLPNRQLWELGHPSAMCCGSAVTNRPPKPPRHPAAPPPRRPAAPPPRRPAAPPPRFPPHPAYQRAAPSCLPFAAL